jgi:hypothetical protein
MVELVQPGARVQFFRKENNRERLRSRRLVGR